MKRHITLLCLLITLSTLAQTPAQTQDTTKYYAGYSSTGTYNRTTANSNYVLSNGIKLGLKRRDLVINSNNKWLYGQQDKALTNNDLSSSWDINFYHLPHPVYYWGMVSYTSSYSLKINNQVQSGVGIAYNIINKGTSQFNISEGILYDYSDIIRADSLRDRYSSARNSVRVQAKYSNEIIAFNALGFLQNSLKDRTDYIVKAEFNLGFKLRKWVSLTTALNYNKITSTQSESLFMTYGLALEKYF